MLPNHVKQQSEVSKSLILERFRNDTEMVSIGKQLPLTREKWNKFLSFSCVCVRAGGGCRVFVSFYKAPPHKRTATEANERRRRFYIYTPTRGIFIIIICDGNWENTRRFHQFVSNCLPFPVCHRPGFMTTQSLTNGHRLFNGSMRARGWGVCLYREFRNEYFLPKWLPCYLERSPADYQSRFIVMGDVWRLINDAVWLSLSLSRSRF